MKVAVVTVSFPVPSEAFAVTEVDALCDEGVALDVFPLLDRPGRDLTGLLQPRVDAGRVRVLSPAAAGSEASASLSLVRAIWLLVRVIGAFWTHPVQAAKSILLLRRALWVDAQIRGGDYDLVHCSWGHHPALVGSLVKRFSDHPVTLFLGSYDLEAPGPLTGWLYRQADRVVTHAEVNRSRLHDRLGAGARIEVVRRGIRVGALPAPPREDLLQLVFAGRLSPDKGGLAAVEVLRLVRQKTGRGRLLVAGDGPEAQAIGAAVAALGLDPWVRAPGFLPQQDLFRELEQAHFLLLPSRDRGERLPNVVKEAMARGAVAILFPSPGISELVEHGVHGFVVQSADEMAELVASLAQDPALRRQVAEAAYSRVAGGFRVEDSARRLAALWATVCSGAQEPS